MSVRSFGSSDRDRTEAKQQHHHHHQQEGQEQEPIIQQHATNASKQETLENVDDFDEILNLVGNKGKYQDWLIYGFVCPFTILMPMLILNIIFMVDEPDHWCHVPGKPFGMTIEDWKNYTIPYEPSSNGLLKLSKCQMYTMAENASDNVMAESFFSSSNRGQIVNCNSEWGWDYDRTNYKETLVSQFNWVCSKSDYVTQALTAFSAGSCVGTIIFGWAGDKFGRKRIFFFLILIVLMSRFVSLFVAENFLLFLMMQFLIGTTFPMMYIAPFTIISEICDREYRSRIYSYSWMIWVVGLCALPLIAYLCADWFLIGLATTIPGILLFGYIKLLPESPRLLLSNGKTDDSLFYLERIAQINGTEVDCAHESKLFNMVKEMELKQTKQKESSSKKIGFWTLFSRIQIAKYTSYLCVVWTVNQLIYYCVTLNTTSMAGNQFINFFILSIIELPAGWIGGKLVELTGRRWTAALFLTICSITFLGTGLTIMIDSSATLIAIGLVVIAKFGVSVSSLVVNLQANEIFPTQLRATGIGFVSTVAGLFAIGGPTLIYLNKVHPAAPYISLAIISIIGTICSTLLPETLGQSLPENIEESNMLGRNMKFWSFLPGKKVSEKASADA